jgi:hypothetical protein
VANAHFPLALAALCVWMSLLIRPPASPGYASALGAGLGVTLALVAPYALIPAAVTGAVALAARRADPELKSGEGPGMLALWLGLLAVLLVWVAYYLSVVSSDPILGAWNAQNQTPSPQPLAYVFAFLPLLIAAGFLAFPTAPPIPARTGRVLLVWILATAAVLYAPFSVQRRFVLGVFVPIGLLAVQGVAGLRIPAYFRNLLFAALLATTAPSHVLVLAAGLESVRSGRSGQVIPDEALAAYRWLAENAPEESLVLAGALAGNQIPAFASVRVIYGHPYETPYAPQALETVRRAFSGDLSPRDAARDWEGPVFVYYGEEERGLGSPAWLDDLELVYSQGGTQIFRDPASP